MESTSLMRAACYENYGSPEVLKVQEVAVPSCAENDVLVQVKYATVNRTDCAFLRADPFAIRFVAGITKPRSNILGCEFSGDVVKTGKNVTEFSVGDRVFGFKDETDGFGGQAQYISMPVKGMLVKIPEQLTYEQAAPGLEGSHYALNGIRSAAIGKSQQVLVNGGTGAIGSAAVQLMHALGAEVTAVCGTAHMEKVAELGASKVIDYQQDDFTQLDATFDFIFDAVGKSTFGKCKHLLKPKGIYHSTELGPFCQNPLLALITRPMGKKQVHFPIPKNLREDAEYLCSLMQQGLFMPLIDQTFALSDITAAYKYVESGEKIGNVLIDVNA